MTSVKDRIAALNKSSGANDESHVPDSGSPENKPKPLSVKERVAQLNKSKSMSSSPTSCSSGSSVSSTSTIAKKNEKQTEKERPVKIETNQEKVEEKTSTSSALKKEIILTEGKEEGKILTIKERKALLRQSVSLPITSSSSDVPEKPETKRFSVSNKISSLQQKIPLGNPPIKLLLTPTKEEGTSGNDQKTVTETTEERIEKEKIIETEKGKDHEKEEEIATDKDKDKNEEESKKEGTDAGKMNQEVERENSQEQGNTSVAEEKTKENDTSLPIPPIVCEGGQGKEKETDKGSHKEKELEKESEKEKEIETEAETEIEMRKEKDEKGEKEKLEEEEISEEGKKELSTTETALSRDKKISARFGGVSLPMPGMKPSSRTSAMAIPISFPPMDNGKESSSDASTTKGDEETETKNQSSASSSTSPTGTLNIGEKPKPGKLPGKFRGASLNLPIMMPGMAHPGLLAKQKAREEEEKIKEQQQEAEEGVPPPKLEHATQTRATMTKKRRPKSKK